MRPASAADTHGNNKTLSDAPAATKFLILVFIPWGVPQLNRRGGIVPTIAIAQMPCSVASRPFHSFTEGVTP
jgi:hypothetical protein